MPDQADIAAVKDYGKGVSDGWELRGRGLGLEDLDKMTGMGPNGFGEIR